MDLGSAKWECLGKFPKELCVAVLCGCGEVGAVGKCSGKWLGAPCQPVERYRNKEASQVKVKPSSKIERQKFG